MNKLFDIAKVFFIEVEKIQPDEQLKFYIKKHFGFFASNPNYFVFYILYISKQTAPFNNEIIAVMKKYIDIFALIIESNNSYLTPDKADLLYRFVFSTGIFVMFFSLHKNSNKKLILLSNNEIDHIIQLIYDIVSYGFSVNKKNINLNYLNIETLSKIEKNELPDRDKIIDGIASVVAEVGIWDTSIDKIAKKLGMCKSSLYFYFKNKNEMLINMIAKEIENLNDIFKIKLANYSEIEEKIYAMIIVMASYFMLDKRIMLVFDWLHYQNIDIKNLKIFHKKNLDNGYIFLVIKEAITNRIIDDKGNDYEFITAFLNMQIAKEIVFAEITNEELSLDNMRYVYQFFMRGAFKNKKNPAMQNEHEKNKNPHKQLNKELVKK